MILSPELDQILVGRKVAVEVGRFKEKVKVNSKVVAELPAQDFCAPQRPRLLSMIVMVTSRRKGYCLEIKFVMKCTNICFLTFSVSG